MIENNSKMLWIYLIGLVATYIQFASCPFPGMPLTTVASPWLKQAKEEGAKNLIAV